MSKHQKPLQKFLKYEKKKSERKTKASLSLKWPFSTI